MSIDDCVWYKSSTNKDNPKELIMPEYCKNKGCY